MLKEIVVGAAVGLGASIALFGANAAQALELQTVPESHVYANAAQLGDGQMDAMVHAIGILNDGIEAITIESVDIDVIVGGISVLTKRVNLDNFGRHTGMIGGMIQSGAGSFVGGMVSNADGPDGLFGQLVTLSTERTLQSDAATLAVRSFLAFDQMPETIRVTVRTVSATGDAEIATKDLTVIAPDRERTYPMPLEGGWFMTAIPLVTSHHRYMPGTEFAIDFFKTNGDGQVHGGDRTDQTDYFGYGEPVHAIAGGTVVRVINGSAEDAAFRVRGQEERPAAYEARMIERFGDDATVNLLASITGNLVIVEQDDGFFASYGHLAPSSVTVQTGTRVEVGEVIAAVGGTGEGNMTTHLHIQLNEGPTALFDQGVPMNFTEDRGQRDTGRIVRSD